MFCGNVLRLFGAGDFFFLFHFLFLFHFPLGLVLALPFVGGVPALLLRLRSDSSQTESEQSGRKHNKNRLLFMIMGFTQSV